MQSTDRMVTQVMMNLHTKKNVSGMSIVEILIGVALGLILLVALYSLLVSNKQTYSSARANTELMSTGQQVSQLITTFVQQAGFRNYARVKGNSFLPTETVTLASTSISWQEKQPLYVLNNATATNPSIKTGTDAIFLHFTGSNNSDMIPDKIRTSMKPVPAGNAADGSIINCMGTGLTNNTATIALFIAKDNTLHCADSSGSDVVIADNIENMQIRINKGNASYVPATGTIDWTTVSNVEIGLLLAKPYDASITYSAGNISLLDESIAITDTGKLRISIVSNVMIRNQLTQ